MFWSEGRGAPSFISMSKRLFSMPSLVLLLCLVTTASGCDSTLTQANGWPACLNVGYLNPVLGDKFVSHDLPAMVFDTAMANLNVTLNATITDLGWGDGMLATQAGTYDLFIANTWVLEKRVMKVDFSTAFMADTFVLISKKPTPLGTDFWFILKPLSWGLWLAAIIAWVAATVCIALTDYADEVETHMAVDCSSTEHSPALFQR